MGNQNAYACSAVFLFPICSHSPTYWQVELLLQAQHQRPDLIMEEVLQRWGVDFGRGPAYSLQSVCGDFVVCLIGESHEIATGQAAELGPIGSVRFCPDVKDVGCQWGLWPWRHGQTVVAHLV